MNENYRIEINLFESGYKNTKTTKYTDTMDLSIGYNILRVLY